MWCATSLPPAWRRRRSISRTAQALLTENHRDTEGARPEREVALQPGDAGHQRIDRSVEIRESVRVSQIVDEGSQRPCTELHPAAHADESGGIEHEIRRIELRAARILARRGPFCAALIFGIEAHKGFVSEDVEPVFHARRSRKRRRGLTTPGLTACTHDGFAVEDQ